MLKWADETRRKLNSCDADSPTSGLRGNNNTTLHADSSPTSSSIPSTGSDEGVSEDDSDAFVSPPRLYKSPSPVQRRKQKHLQNIQQRRRHSSCGQLYASPEQIVLAWDNNQQGLKTKQQMKVKDKVLTSPRDNSDNSFTSHLGTSDTAVSNKESHGGVSKISTKPELLQITTKESDKNRSSFWKNLIGKKSWPNKTYKSTPTRKSQSVIETYRKIEEGYYLDSENNSSEHDTKHHDGDADDYGLPNLVISCDALDFCDSSSRVAHSRSYHSLKTIRRHSENRRPKLFMGKGGRSHSPDSGFSDIRLSMSTTDDFDHELDSGVPRSPTLSSSSSGSNNSVCHRKP